MMETSAFYLHISRQWSSSCRSVHLPAIHQNVKIKELSELSPFIPLPPKREDVLHQH